MMSLTERIGQRLKAARERNNLTQRELANKIGKSQKSISEYENGERGIRLDDLPTFASALGVTVAELVEEDKNRGELVANYERLIPAFQQYLLLIEKHLGLIQTELITNEELKLDPYVPSIPPDPVVQKNLSKAESQFEAFIVPIPENGLPQYRVRITTNLAITESKGLNFINFSSSADEYPSKEDLA